MRIKKAEAVSAFNAKVIMKTEQGERTNNTQVYSVQTEYVFILLWRC